MKKQESVIGDKANSLIELMGVSAKTEVVKSDDGFSVNIETENPAILIGYHGEGLSALQTILSLTVYREIGEWLRVFVDVGGYRQKRKESLEKMALSAVQRVKFSRQECELPPMSPSERRIIHVFLSSDPEVATESIGEGRERRIVIKPNSAK